MQAGKMKNNVLIMATTGLFYCGQGSESMSDTVNKETLNSTENVRNQKPLINVRSGYYFGGMILCSKKTGWSETVNLSNQPAEDSANQQAKDSAAFL